MIKILRKGDPERLKRTIRFGCKICGCVFEADQDEYKRQYYSQREAFGGHEIKCPCCGKWVTQDTSFMLKMMDNKRGVK